MKGLALIMGMKPKGGAKAPPFGKPAPDKPEAESAEAPTEGGAEKEYARIAAEAIADGDTEAAADALVSMVKACMGSYGPEE